MPTIPGTRQNTAANAVGVIVSVEQATMYGGFGG
jgi:hypothetical protein